FEALYDSVWGIPPRDGGRVDLSSLAEMDTKRSRSQKASLDSGFWRDRRRGWSVAEGVRSPMVDGNRHARHGSSRSEANFNLLLNSVTKCQEKGIEVVLVSTPTHEKYHRWFSEDYLAETSQYLQRLRRERNVRFLDFGADPRFVDADFYDTDHLNHSGAIKFT